MCADRAARLPDRILLDGPIRLGPLPPIEVLFTALLVTESLSYVRPYLVIHEGPPVRR